MKLQFVFSAAVFSLLLGGCSSGKLTTQSGRPEIHIYATPKHTLTRIVQWAPSVGQQVMLSDTNLWVVKTTHKMNAYLNGFPLPSNTDASTTFTIVPMEDSVIVYEQRMVAYTTNEKDKYGRPSVEHHYDEYATQRAYDEMQAELVSIARKMK
ncbi:MAG: hypothetical protein ACHQM6_04620 [Candidatus Kapaibacterium sp.]